jgi:SAM-dependent methyltransferase
MRIPIPSRVKNSIKVLLGTMRAVSVETGESVQKLPFGCPVCGSAAKAFLPLSQIYYDKYDEHGYIHSIFLSETINRQAYFCPNCRASDRDRLYALYMQKDGYLRSGRKRVLEIGPSKPLTRYIKSSFPSVHYRTADLYADGVDDHIDITNMSIYADGQYDFLLCSHVLEHVQDDEQAIAELYRVLSNSGRGIVMAPINLGLTDDYENRNITTPEGRWKHFGQDDHVRLYSKAGFTGKLKNAGFNVHEYGIDFFGRDLFHLHGIHPRSVLYIVSKT